ncbi:MAG: biotin--[acetyl-CoA-carboxylase] ligase, partial [Terriglobales bacterium]
MFTVSGLVTDNAGIAKNSKTDAERAPRPPASGRRGNETPTDARLARIVRLLADNATVVVSGEKIAGEIGVSRSEVWRLVEQLRGQGVRIAGHSATGYQLEEVPDLMLPEFLLPAVRGTIFEGHLRHYFRIGSTNIAAMEAAAAGAPEGTALLAEEQTAGRGRGGHAWHSAPSTGIYCSAILRPALPPADALRLSLMTGLAVRAAIAEVTGMTADLRWPNDLLLNGKKCCGILIEMNAEVTRVRYVVAGIGINVNHGEFPAELQDVATSLRVESGRSWSRVEVAGALLKSLDREYRGMTSTFGPAEGSRSHTDLLRRFEAASSYARGRRVRVEEGGGYEGVTEGLDERGFLRVKTVEGVRTVLSGGVR